MKSWNVWSEEVKQKKRRRRRKVTKKKNSIRLKRLIMMIIRVEHISLFYFQPSLSLSNSSMCVLKDFARKCCKKDFKLFLPKGFNDDDLECHMDFVSSV